ncbi:hypothetical protein CCP4SC76_7640012 [Gammaproteobacteria bacterium]
MTKGEMVVSLTCSCDELDGVGWCYEPEEYYSELKTKRGRPCCSCGKPIKVGDTVVRFGRERGVRSDLEERIHGDMVPLAPYFMCEVCGDLYYSLDDLGFCVNPRDNMRELVREYAELASTKHGIESSWKPIETIPHYEFVWAYCRKAHESKGAASESKGGFVICYVPPTDKLPGKFISHSGCLMLWEFSHWMPLPEPPTSWCGDRGRLK